VPAGVEFVSQLIGAFAKRLRGQAGKNSWLMGSGEIIAPRHREVALHLRSVTPFPGGVVQVHYDIRKRRANAARDER
jgi:hypothetical protein